MLTPRDLAKLGMLFLQRGRWEGASIVDAEHVAAATANQSRGGRPEDVGYGFLWWVDDFAAPPAYFAAGHGGQYVYVAPALDLVVVTTADAYASPPRFGRPIRNLIESYVVAAARNAR